MFGKKIKTNVGSPQGDVASAILFIIHLASRQKEYKAKVEEDDPFIEIQYADDLDWVSGKERYTNNVKENIPNILKDGNLKYYRLISIKSLTIISLTMTSASPKADVGGTADSILLAITWIIAMVAQMFLPACGGIYQTS